MNREYMRKHASIKELEAERERIQGLIRVSQGCGDTSMERYNLRKLDDVNKHVARLRAGSAAINTEQDTATESDEQAAVAEEKRLATQLMARVADEIADRTVKPPQWFPQHTQGLPTVALPAQGRMAFWIPGRTHARHEEFLKIHLRSSAQPEWAPDQQCWTVSKTHFIRLASVLLARHPRVVLAREYDSSEKCNERCRNARGPYCTCSCRARNHARGKWMDGWSIEKETTGLTNGREWSWLTISLT